MDRKRRALRPWPRPLRDDAYHGLAGDIVRTIEPHSEADPAAVLVQFLTAFGHSIGRRPHFKVENDRHGMNLYTVLVGKTARSRKGVSLGRVQGLFGDVKPPSLSFLTRDAAEPGARDGTAWEALRVRGGLSSGEGLIWHVRDPIKSLDKGKKDDPGVSDKRVLIVETEFGSALQIVERPGNILSPVLRDAWDGKEILETLAKNSPVRATGAHISIIGHITKDELRRWLTQTQMANGFGNRFLWVCVQRSKLLPNGGNLPKTKLGRLRTAVAEAVDFARRSRRIERHAKADQLWKEIYAELSNDTPGLLGAMIARAEPQVMRLACIYALLDKSLLLRVEHLEAARAVWDYCEDSAAYIFGGRLGDSCADKILGQLHTTRSDGLTRTEIRNLFSNNQTQERIEAALRLLEDHRLAQCVREKTDGRPVERWFAADAESDD